MGDILNYTYYNVIAWNKDGAYKQLPENISGCDVINAEHEFLLFLKFDQYTSYAIPDLNGLIVSLNILYKKIQSPFIILTQKKDAPILTASEDEFVYSFSCKIALYNKLIMEISHTGTIDSTDLLFELLDQLITHQLYDEEILIRQMPIIEGYKDLPTTGDVIIPHRGDNDFLQRVLMALTHNRDLNIFVGIDQEITEPLQLIISKFPQINFYSFTPHPVGPYVIRNRLIQSSHNDLLFFHDSDDISCTDRFEKLSSCMMINDYQYCGSHELRLDYSKRTLQAVRFPKDVTQSLASGPWFPLLHPTSVIKRKSFYKCGTLSEERIFANDTKFLLNSYFYLPRIGNIDEFLYIRRIHPGSLTTAEETKLGSPVRKELLRRWNSDFELVKNGTLNLYDSSLNFSPTNLNVDFFPIYGSLP